MAKGKKVLVTGVAGFVGSNFAKLALEKGHSVIGIDNLSQGFKRNLKGFEKIGDFEFIKTDVRDGARLSRVLGRKKIDYIVHLAAYKIPRYGNAMDTLMINSKGTETMIEIALKKKAKFVFASTSDVYGKNPDIPFSEESKLVLGSSKVKRWAYAASKIFDEHLCFAYEEKSGLKMTILRFFGGYGANQNLTWWGGPQSVFIDCALNNKAMTLHGDGRQTRSFTYVEDMVRGVYLAMITPASTGEIFNIGNNREINIKGLAEMTWKMVRKSKPKIKLIPYDHLSKGYEDVRRRVPDIRKAKKVLGFEARVQLEQGLPVTIEWQKGASK
ncbi:MAG: GDP-mannose 4,6-dehydratase [Candidatus Tantalella remota]|nr:GDP-mannose 4,6-dehydratase [Candidatus Tantalella remota]